MTVKRDGGERFQERGRNVLSLGAKLACALLLLLGAGGCVLGGDDPPILSVELLWNRSSNPNRFSQGSCDSAGVEWMDWVLEDQRGRAVREGEPDGEECADLFHFTEMLPGSYSLSIFGYDENDELLWSVKCTHLDIERFDARYSCSIGYAEPE